MMDYCSTVLEIKQEPADVPSDLMKYGELNELSKSIYNKLSEVFGHTNPNLCGKETENSDFISVRKETGDCQRDINSEKECGDMYAVKNTNDFNRDLPLLSIDCLPFHDKVIDGKSSSNDKTLSSDQNVEVFRKLPVNSKHLSDNIMNSAASLDNSKANLALDYSAPIVNESKTQYLKKDRKKAQNRKKIKSKNKMGNNKKRLQCKKGNKKSSSFDNLHLLNKNIIKKEPVNLIEHTEHKTENVIKSLIKEEIVGLMKADVEFDMSQVQDLPKMATTQSEANLYMKSYMHNTTFASGLVEEDKPCCCQYCGKVFVCGQNLVKHLEQHAGDRPHVCDICGKTFKIRQNLQRHYVIHTGEKLYKCEVCEKAFATYTTFSKHKVVHTGEKNHECDLCGKKFAHRTNLKSHRLLHLEDRPFKCHLCHKGFNKNANLRSHMKVHLGVKPHKCEHCGKGFPEKFQLTMHVRSHTNERPYQCSVCERRFNQVSNLYTHMRFHSEDVPFVCEICGKGYRIKIHLEHHVMKHNGDRQYKCNLCQKEYWFRGELNRHMRKHTGEKTHKCELCDATFFTLGEVRVHLRGGHGGQMYSCEHCGQEFLRLSNKLRHERIHIGVRPHECNICGAKFFQKTELRDHRYRHDGIFPFPCDLCQKQFRKRSQYNEHRKIHTGEGIVECLPCNKKFNYKSSYKKHCESERHFKKEAIYNGTDIRVDNSKKVTTEPKRNKKKQEVDKGDNFDVTENVSGEDSSGTVVHNNYTSSLKESSEDSGNTSVKLIIRRDVSISELSGRWEEEKKSPKING